MEEFEVDDERLLFEWESEGGGLIFDVFGVDWPVVVAAAAAAVAVVAGMSDEDEVSEEDESPGKALFKVMDTNADGLTSESRWRKKIIECR